MDVRERSAEGEVHILDSIHHNLDHGYSPRHQPGVPLPGVIRVEHLPNGISECPGEAQRQRYRGAKRKTQYTEQH